MGTGDKGTFSLNGIDKPLLTMFKIQVSDVISSHFRRKRDNLPPTGVEGRFA